MSRRIMLTLPDSLFKKLESLGIHHESDSELVRLALEIFLYEKRKKND